MNLFIFDMDGVLVMQGGYHSALKDTVRLSARQAGLGEVTLSDEQVVEFEALGITSEWHSSAVCMAWMDLMREHGRTAEMVTGDGLNLTELYEEIAIQPFENAPIQRGMAALERIAARRGIEVGSRLEMVEMSEDIHSSQTKKWFQEMILGSELYTRVYHKPASLNTESYLKLHDTRLLDEEMAKKILLWATKPGQGAAIMTSRPSEGPAGFAEQPDARIGVEMIGLERLPLVGNGEIRWMCDKTSKSVHEMKKPAKAHALAAILVASGWAMDKSLSFTAVSDGRLNKDDLMHLDGSTITVFEDTMAGIIAVDKVAGLLREAGLQVEVRKFGITQDASKITALEGLGAKIYADINQVLADIGL
jgi:hypothetical protein